MIRDNDMRWRYEKELKSNQYASYLPFHIMLILPFKYIAWSESICTFPMLHTVNIPTFEYITIRITKLSNPIFLIVSILTFISRAYKRWWYEMVIRDDDMRWWYEMMIWDDDMRWWYEMMIRDDDTRWWYEMMIWDDDMRWWYEMMIRDDDTRWWCDDRKYVIDILICTMVGKTLTTCTNDGSSVSSRKVTFSYVQLFVTDFNYSAAAVYFASAVVVNHGVVGAMFVDAGITYPSPYTPIYSKRNDDMFVNTTMTISVHLNKMRKELHELLLRKKTSRSKSSFIPYHSSRIILMYQVMSYHHLECV